MLNDVSALPANPAKKKPRGKPFVSGDSRANLHGTRTAADVAFNRSLREIIASVGNEKGKEFTRVEEAVRGLYAKAAKGDVSAFNALIERVEGRVPQQNEITGKDGKDFTITIVELAAKPDAER